MMYWCLIFKSFVISSMKDLGPFFKNVNDCLQWTFSLFNGHKFELLCFSFDLSDHTLAIINSMLVFMFRLSLLLVKHKLFG